MITKREVLEEFAKNGDCENINCREECPYYFSDKCIDLYLRKIGAMAILRMFPKKLESRVFDKSKILTCVTADKAKVGMKGYFADNLTQLKLEFDANRQSTLIEKQGEDCVNTFVADDELGSVLFYPIDEVEE